jgi:hypothetical protein
MIHLLKKNHGLLRTLVKVFFTKVKENSQDIFVPRTTNIKNVNTYEAYAVDQQTSNTLRSCFLGTLLIASFWSFTPCVRIMYEGRKR